MMKKLKIPLIIIGIALVLVIVLNIRACIKENRIEAVAEIQGEFNAYKAEAAKDKVELLQLKEKAESQIEVLKKAISELNVKTAQYREEIKIKDGELQDLKTEFSLLDEEDKDAKILNLTKQVGNLEGQVRKAMKGWDAAEAKAKGWELALNKKSEYCVKLEKQLGISENLLKISETLGVKKDKQIARLKLGKTIERIVTLPLAVYGGFKIGQAVFGGK